MENQSEVENSESTESVRNPNEVTLEEVLNRAIHNEQNAINFGYLKQLIFTLLDIFDLRGQGIELSGRGFSSTDLDSMLSQSAESAASQHASTKFNASKVKAIAKLNKLKKSPSVITDSFKFQQAEHRIEGHDQDIKSILSLLDKLSATVKVNEMMMDQVSAKNNAVSGKLGGGLEQISELETNLEKTNNDLLVTGELAQKAYEREVPWDILTIAMKFFHDRTEKERSIVYDQHEGVEAFVATVDSTHLKFVQQADLKTQMEDLEYRSDTKMDLINHDTQKQIEELNNEQDEVRQFINKLQPILAAIAPADTLDDLNNLAALIDSVPSQTNHGPNQTKAPPSHVNLRKQSIQRRASGSSLLHEKDIEKKVREVMDEMLGEQASAISDVNEKLVQMEGLIYDLRRDFGLVTDQVDGITETLEGQVQGKSEEADAERKAIMEDLENKFMNMESDLKRLLNSDKTEDQFAKINAMFEEFRMNTITKDEFLTGIEDKADRGDIANIIQREEFDEGVTCLNESLNSLAEKLKKHMQIEKRINSLATETERKISREELVHIQKDIESEFGTLKKLMDIKDKADKKRKAKWAAIGIPVNCISCKDKSYQNKYPFMANGESSATDSTAVHAALELKEALPSNISVGPYKSYELNTLRTLSRQGQNITKAIRNNEIHRHRVSLEQLKSMGPRISSSHGRRSRPNSGTGQRSSAPVTPADKTQLRQSESSIWQGRTSKANKKLNETEKKTDEKMLEEVILFSDNGTIYRGAQ